MVESLENDIENETENTEQNFNTYHTVVDVKSAAAAVGISEYCLRKKIKQGFYPYILTSGAKRARILIDIDLLREAMKQEALHNQNIRRKINQQYELERNKKILVLGDVLKHRKS